MMVKEKVSIGFFTGSTSIPTNPDGFFMEVEIDVSVAGRQMSFKGNDIG